MYNIKGPSKFVAKTTRRGISQNMEGLRDNSKNTKSLDTNENEVGNGPKPVFHINSKRNVPGSPNQPQSLTPQDQEIIKYVQESWMSASSDANGDCASTNINRNRYKGNCTLYYEDDPCPQLQDFKPFDLESWWGKRLYNLITNSVAPKNYE